MCLETESKRWNGVKDKMCVRETRMKGGKEGEWRIKGVGGNEG